MIIQCANCGVDFNAKPSAVAKGKKFCSMACMAAKYKEVMHGCNNPNFRNAAVRCCERCGGEFTSYDKRRRFCSRRCWGLSPEIQTRLRRMADASRGRRFSRGRVGSRRVCKHCGVEFRTFTRATYCPEHKEVGRMNRGHGGRLDKNQNQIVEALRSIGASVLSLADLGRGVPDLLVSYNNVLYLLEVKNPGTSYGRHGFNKLQQDWHDKWRGRKPVIVRSPAEALKAVGFEGMIEDQQSAAK